MPWGELAHERPPWMRVRLRTAGLALRRARRHRPHRGPGHGLRGGALPEHRRVLGPRAPRRSRSWATRARAPAATAPSTRPSAASRSTRSSPGASPPPRRAWDSATSSSRPSTATTSTTAAPSTGRARSARCAGGCPTAGIEVLTPDFLGREEESLVTVLERAPARLQPQHRDRAPHPAARAHQGRLRARALAAAAGARGLGRALARARAADGEVGHRRRHGRDRRRDRRDARATCARTASTSSRSASTCSRPSGTCRSTAGSPLDSFRRFREAGRADGLRLRLLPARSCARPTAPRSSSSRPRAPCAPARCDSPRRPPPSRRTTHRWLRSAPRSARR